LNMAIRIMLSRKLGELRWTQADLARRTGIRPSTINDMYHELCERVNLEYLDRICTVLDCDLTYILEYIPPTDKEETKRLYRKQN
jgi:putative transcriptional regulator